MLLKKKVILTLLTLALLSCLLNYAMAAQTERAGRGAFIKYKVESTNGLVNQLTSNPNIAARYARHFGATEQAVIQYFRNNLKLTTLQKPKRSTVYFIGKNGSILSGTRLLPAGSRVFVNQSGQMILEWRCGNPLIKKLPEVPKQAAKLSTAPKVTAPPTEVASEPLVPPVNEDPFVQVAAGGPIEIGQLPPPITSVALPSVAELQSAVASPVIAGVEPVLETIASAPITNVPSAVLSASKSSYTWMLPVIAGGAGVLVSRDSDKKASEVPEPASIMALVSGLAVTGITWRRRRIH